MAEDIAGAVDTWPFAIPEAENTIEPALAPHFGLLRPPDRGRGEVFVEAGLEDDIARRQRLFGAQEIEVETAEGRAAIARDEAGGIQPGAAVDCRLHEQKADNSLRSRDEDAVLGKVVFVGERQQRGRALGFFDVRHFAFAPRQEDPAWPHWELTV